MINKAELARIKVLAGAARMSWGCATTRTVGPDNQAFCQHDVLAIEPYLLDISLSAFTRSKNVGVDCSPIMLGCVW